MEIHLTAAVPFSRGRGGVQMRKDTLPVLSRDPEIVDQVHHPVAFEVFRVAVPHLRTVTAESSKQTHHMTSECLWQTHAFQESDLIQGRLCKHLSAPHDLQSHKPSFPARSSHTGDLLNLPLGSGSRNKLLTPCPSRATRWRSDPIPAF